MCYQLKQMMQSTKHPEYLTKTTSNKSHRKRPRCDSPSSTTTHKKKIIKHNSNNVLLQNVLRDIERYERDCIIGTKVAEAWNSLGLISLYMEKNIKEAIRCFEKALAIHKHSSSSSSPVDVAVSLGDLAKCYERLEDRSTALSLYEQVIELLEHQKVSESHPVLAAGRRYVLKATVA